MAKSPEKTAKKQRPAGRVRPAPCYYSIKHNDSAKLFKRVNTNLITEKDAANYVKLAASLLLIIYSLIIISIIIVIYRIYGVLLNLYYNYYFNFINIIIFNNTCVTITSVLPFFFIKIFNSILIHIHRI